MNTKTAQKPVRKPRGPTGEIDWTRACYAPRTFRRSRLTSCDVCGEDFEEGDSYRAGPREKIAVHTKCVPAIVYEPAR